MTSPTADDRHRHVFVDVSNTLAVPYQTGFQRHTRELLRRLPGPDDAGPIRFIPVRWCLECGTFRRLDPGESAQLATFRAPATPPRSRLSQLADPLPGPVRSALARAIRLGPVQALRDRAAQRRRLAAHPAGHGTLRIDEWPRDSWLFDLEAAWHNVPHRAELLPAMAARGVRTATLIADVMPTQFPEWFDDGQIRLFTSFIDAHLDHSERFVCISRCSERDVVEYSRRRGDDRPLRTSVITMGANFRVAAANLPRPESAPPGRFILSVGTVEPRKNHALLLDAFDRLADEIPDLSLAIVGKAGWMTEAITERMRAHPLAGGRLRWLDHVDDDTLDGLYRHAFVSVQPAFYEGFGTPVIEALANGLPTIASNGGALVEAGGARAEFFDPHRLDELVTLLRRHATDDAYHRARREALSDYRPPTWEDGAAGIVAALSPDALTPDPAERTRAAE